ncbi:MYG1 family protein [Novipirellula sp. SH528]|uniref:MYG1 family protein n=1 Tax=Novipirellula sp. SH528 TaxID=3454466 RepID=UPI003F9FA773
MTMQLIVTHPGGAHKDDFLACCLLAHLHGVPIQRREPTDDDLANPSICVVDVGGAHDQERNNFDHHQFPRDAPPLCALSLVLQSMGLYEDALSFCAWLRPAEWLDTLGPNEAAKLMGIPRTALGALNSPLDTTLLNRFASQTQLDPESPIHQVMCMVGEDIVNYLRSLRQRLDYLKEHGQYWTIETDGEPIQALFLEKSDIISDDPSFGVYAFIESEGKEDQIQATIYPDRRGSGYGLSRYNDSQRLDFSQIESHDLVRFAHKRGFVAKVSTTDPTRLKELLALAIVKTGN